MRSLLNHAVRLGRVILDFLVDLAVFPGTNFLGVVLFLVVGLGLSALQDEVRLRGVAELFIIAAGIICLGLDIGLRKALGHESILEYERGARLLFLPLWMWGVVW